MSVLTTNINISALCVDNLYVEVNMYVTLWSCPLFTEAT